MTTEICKNLLISMRQIIRATDLHSKKLIREYGLTTPQILVLRAADDQTLVTIRMISDSISLSQATVTTILNRLEQRNLVSRERSASDKRTVRVRLTDAGRQVLADAPDLLHESFIRKFNALAQWEQTMLLSSVQRIAAMMEAEKLDAAPLLDVGAPDGADR